MKKFKKRGGNIILEGRGVGNEENLIFISRLISNSIHF